MSEQAITQPVAPAATQTVLQTRVRCRHIHTAGNQCGSPALRNEIFCYYHHTTRRPKAAPGGFRYLNATEPFQLPIIEDRASALAVASEIMCRIASNDLDITRAGRLIYNLQVLAAFLPREPKPASAQRHPEGAKEPAPHTATPTPAAQSTPSAPESPDLVTDIVDDETHGLIAPPASPADPVPPTTIPTEPEEPTCTQPTAPPDPEPATPTNPTAPPTNPTPDAASAPITPPPVTRHSEPHSGSESQYSPLVSSRTDPMPAPSDPPQPPAPAGDSDPHPASESPSSPLAPLSTNHEPAPSDPQSTTTADQRSAQT
jgi:hypothetical protein